MRVTLTTMCLLLGLVAASVSAQQKTLLFFSMYDSKTLDTGALGRLGDLRPFDLAAVTPGAAASAHALIPAAGLSALIGDPESDGSFAAFAGLPQGRWGLGAPFVKWDEKTGDDPRRIFWTVREAGAPATTIQVFEGTALSTVRVGDWVRLTERGEAEFFIKQEHIMAAAGIQSGAHVKGATAICQSANKDLYYVPAHGWTGSATAGGSWVSNGTAQTFAFDGAICYIPANAITYDGAGNVTSIMPGTARLVANEVGSGPNNEPSVRTMVQSSGAVDSIGKTTTITFMMNGLDIDPNGGTWTGWYGNTHPNLIFSFENPATSCCGGPWGSWVGTIFSTAGLGSIARINGRLMGATSGNADGAWTGIAAASGSSNAPILRGVCWIDAGWASAAPYGNCTLQTANDGLVTLTQDPNARLDIQAPIASDTNTVFLGFGPAPGARPLSADLSVLLDGFRSVHVLNSPTGPVKLVGTRSNAAGQSQATIPVPPLPPGTTFILQVACNTPGRPQVTNPVLVEVR